MAFFIKKHSWSHTPKITNIKYQILPVDLNSFSWKTVTQTYVRHMNCVYYLYIVVEIWNQKISSITPRKFLFSRFRTTSFILQPKRNCFLPLHLDNSIVMFISKEIYWRRTSSTIRYTWYYNILSVLREKQKL